MTSRSFKAIPSRTKMGAARRLERRPARPVGPSGFLMPKEQAERCGKWWLRVSG